MTANKLSCVYVYVVLNRCKLYKFISSYFCFIFGVEMFRHIVWIPFSRSTRVRRNWKIYAYLTNTTLHSCSGHNNYPVSLLSCSSLSMPNLELNAFRGGANSLLHVGVGLAAPWTCIRCWLPSLLCAMVQACPACRFLCLCAE